MVHLPEIALNVKIDDPLGYEEALRIQSQTSHLGFLIFRCQPVVTLGHRQSGHSQAGAATDLRWPRSEFDRLGISILASDRGGLTALHGPWQVMIFPTGSLAQWQTLGTFGSKQIKFKDLLERMHLMVRALAARLTGISESAFVLNPSVCGNGLYFYDEEMATLRKLAYFGFRVRRQGFSHGMALNLWCEEGLFESIVPCGEHSAAKATGLLECMGILKGQPSFVSEKTKILQALKADAYTFEDV